MGNVTSFMGKGLPSTQMLNFMTSTLYKPFVDKDIRNVDDFHTAVLDICNTFNSAVSGNVPSKKEVEECFKSWEKAPESEKKKVFTDFMKKSVMLSRPNMGLPSTQMLNFMTATLYKSFVDEDIRNFDDFHTTFLYIFNIINSAVLENVPSNKEVEECFKSWEKAPESGKKKVFTDFMKKSVMLSRLNDSTMITGIVTAAMAAKKASETVPQLKMIKDIPDVIFVPTTTVFALVFSKVTKGMFL